MIGKPIDSPWLYESAGPRSGWVAACITFLLATSSIVFIEPAPYDLIAIALLGLLLVNGHRFSRDLQMPVLLLGCFVAGNMLAATVSDDPAATVRSLSIRLYMGLTWLLLVSVVLVDPYRMLKAIWLGYMVAAVIATLWGGLEYLGVLPGEQWQGGLRAKGPFKDPNVYGPFLVPAAIYALSQILGQPWRRIIIYFSLFLLFVLGILLSFSRGAWMNFAVSFMLFSSITVWTATAHRQRITWLLAGTVICAIVAFAIVAAVSTDVVGDRFFQRATLVQKYDTAEGGRFDTQLEALAMVGRNPLGVGPGRSDDAFGLEPHNLYLHSLTEGGWLAGLGLLGFLAWHMLNGLGAVSRRWPLRPQATVILACTAGTLLQSFFIDSTHWRHLWLLLALLGAISLSERRDRRETQLGLMSKSRF